MFGEKPKLGRNLVVSEVRQLHGEAGIPVCVVLCQ